MQSLDEKDKLLLKLSYCEYKFLQEEFSEAEVLAAKTIENTEKLIKNRETEDLGWLITRRSLSLFKNKCHSREALQSLINQL